MMDDTEKYLDEGLRGFATLVDKLVEISMEFVFIVLVGFLIPFAIVGKVYLFFFPVKETKTKSRRMNR